MERILIKYNLNNRCNRGFKTDIISMSEINFRCSRFSCLNEAWMFGTSLFDLFPSIWSLLLIICYFIIITVLLLVDNSYDDSWSSFAFLVVRFYFAITTSLGSSCWLKFIFMSTTLISVSVSTSIFLIKRTFWGLMILVISRCYSL